MPLLNTRGVPRRKKGGHAQTPLNLFLHSTADNYEKLKLKHYKKHYYKYLRMCTFQGRSWEGKSLVEEMGGPKNVCNASFSSTPELGITLQTRGTDSNIQIDRAIYSYADRGTYKQR